MVYDVLAVLCRRVVAAPAEVQLDPAATAVAMLLALELASCGCRIYAWAQHKSNGGKEAQRYKRNVQGCRRYPHGGCMAAERRPPARPPVCAAYSTPAERFKFRRHIPFKFCFAAQHVHQTFACVNPYELLSISTRWPAEHSPGLCRQFA